MQNFQDILKKKSSCLTAPVFEIF